MNGNSNGFLVIVVLIAFLVGYSVVVSVSKWRDRGSTRFMGPGHGQRLGSGKQPTAREPRENDGEIDRLQRRISELTAENDALRRTTEEKGGESGDTDPLRNQ